jgi:GMP synthase-like glutamine amidotransferase
MAEARAGLADRRPDLGAGVRVLVLKPHELADPGLVGEALRDRGAELVEHVLADLGAPASLDGFDAVVVMGAPWSVYGDEVAGWIEGLLGTTREAVEGGVPMLGICFGAQAFAQALGGHVMRAADHEVGVREVQTDDSAIVPPGPWFMWHGDTFEVPAGAEVIARTAAGPQAYTYGPHLLVQFHPEATADIVAAWMDYDDTDFHTAGVDPAETLETLRVNEEPAAIRAAALVDRLLERVP